MRAHLIKPLEMTRKSGSRPKPMDSLSSLSPYKPVSSLNRIWAKTDLEHFKLDWNESSVPPSPLVYQAIVAFLSNSNHLNWYPELGSRSLANSLSDYTGIDEEQILVTNGSDDALELICKTYLGEGDKVLIPTPTYTHFLVYVQSRGARIEEFYAQDLFSSDISQLEKKVARENYKLVYLVSPNNPTGVVYTKEEMTRLAEAAPSTLFIVDEAYHEFYGESVCELVNTYENIVVTRTFSKAFGIAGLRIGYLMSCPSIITELKKLFNPKSVNRLGQIAAQACLSDLPHYNRYVGQVNAAKQILEREFGSRGLLVRSTPANYMLLKVPSPVEFCEMLAQEGVYVRDRSNQPRLDGFVRITVPTPAQIPEILGRFDKVLSHIRFDA